MRTARRVMMAAAVTALLAAGCSSDDGDDAAPADEGSPTTTVADAPSTTSDGSSDDAGGASVGSVTVDGETRNLESISGAVSCQELDDGSFSVAATTDGETPEDDTFVRLDEYTDADDNKDFTMSVGDTQYVAESAAAIDYSIDGGLVTGTVDVVPQLDEGTAQQVTFEIDCNAA